MKKLDSILQYNYEFVKDEQYKVFETSKHPEKKILILGCMDTRLIELLPKAMNIKNGDAKIIKNAGGIITDSFGHEMRSIIISVYEFNIDEIYIVGHHKCGVCKLESDYILDKAVKRGISKETINTMKASGINLEKWITGFETVEMSVADSVNIVKNHPLIPKELIVHGMVICPETGKLDVTINGYNN